MYNPISKPFHYTSTKLEVIDAIETWNLPYHLGNVLKYIIRAGKKPDTSEVTDLQKAAWYLERYTEKRRKELVDVFYHAEGVEKEVEQFTVRQGLVEMEKQEEKPDAELLLKR